jgi:hypothetical protein
MIVPSNNAPGATFGTSDAGARRPARSVATSARAASPSDVAELVAGENRAAAIGSDMSSLDQAMSAPAVDAVTRPEFDREF